jgi:hypothetical protein
MRASEFISEAKKAKAHPEHVSTMPRSMVFPDMDPGYNYYRFMNVVAAHPHHKAPHDHDHFRDHPFASVYTDEEHKMLKDSLKGLGYKTKWLTKEKGKEPDSVHKISPVPHNSGKRKKK